MDSQDADMFCFKEIRKFQYGKSIKTNTKATEVLKLGSQNNVYR